MSERKINLEEIWSKYEKFSKVPNLPGAIDLGYFKPTVNAMMLEFGKQILELASENARGKILLMTETGVLNYSEVDKQSILNTIKQIE